MLEIVRELETLITGLITSKKELLDKNLPERFVIGKFESNLRYASDSQIITMLSILESRASSCVEVGIERLIAQTHKECEDFKTSLLHFEKIKDIEAEISENKTLLYEAKALLSTEEKVEYFKANYRVTPIELEPVESPIV